MNVQNMNAFRAWRELGYTDLIPIVPPGAELTPDCHYSPQALGKQPGVPWRDGKWGPIKGWQHLTPNDDQIDHWGRIGASVGLRKGHVVAVDIDAMDERQGNEIEAAAISMLGPAPMRVGQWPKRALLYRTEPGAKFPKLRFKGVSGRSEQIEVPPQTVLDGIHSKTGLPYTWPRGKAPADALTLLTPEKWEAFHSAMRERLPFPDAGEGSSGIDRDTVDQARLRGNPDLIARAMRALPNRHELFGYDEWVKIATALRGAVDYELGLELFEEFSERSDLTETLEQPWRVFASVQPPFGLGASYLLDLAEKHSPQGATIKAEGWLENADEPVFAPETAASLFGGSAVPKRLAFETMDQAANRALDGGAAPLIDGLLDQGAMTVLYGDSNSGKTFVALDMAYHISVKKPWAGMETAGLPVAYVAAEGGHGFRKRVAALRLQYGSSDAFHVLVSPVDLRRSDADLEPLIAAVKDLAGVGLVVLDTLSRIIAGGDENSSVDMGALVKNLDRLRSACGCHVLVVHHTGKDAARGARGHSLLRAATDTEIEIRDREIAVKKQRDLEGEWSSGFDLRVLEIGKDGRGRAVTSCVIGLVDAAARAVVEAEGSDGARGQVAPTRTEREVLQAFDTTDDAIGPADVVIHFAARNEIINLNAARHHLKVLTSKGWLQKAERGRWTKVPKTPSEVAEIVSATLPSGGKWRNGQSVHLAESGEESGGNVFD